MARRLADVLLVSSVDDTYECDTFFPKIPSDYSLSYEEVSFYGNCKVLQQEYLRNLE
ncbi:hypothetical protein [Rhodococcoides fascians]|uniref:hypothetical protein n=1 Tax=Rhodococcoides fascians TaxID=1828 RepID=UPI0035303B75